LPSEEHSTELSAPAVTVADDFMNMIASTSKHRLITIEIEQNGRIIAILTLSDNSTIGNFLLIFIYK